MKVEKQNNGIDQNPIGGFSISIALCFLLFFYAPLEIFFCNISEFWFDFLTMILPISITFIVLSSICCLFFWILKRISIKFYRLGIAVFFVVFVCSYIQGNFFLGNLPPMDGVAIDWEKYAAGRIETIVCWGGVLCITLVLVHVMHWYRFCRIVRGIGIGMTVILGISIVILGITTGGFKRKLMPFATTENLYEVSENKNFIIFVLDAVDAEAFSNVMKADPGSRDVFADFTYYENTVGAYPCTMLSIPFILSGEWFENEVYFKDYLVQAYENAPLIRNLDVEEYRMNLYEQGTDCLPDAECIYKFDNMICDKANILSPYTFAKWQVLLSGFKYAPFDLKRFCLSYPEAFQELMKLSAGYSAFTSNNIEFYEGIQNGEWTYTNDNCFKFIHIEGGHPPFRYDKDVQLIEDGTYEQNLEACITITKAYLNKLKEMDAYDNSAIIIMADHGYVNLYEDGRQNPILFIKGIGETHELRISQAPISYEDLQEAYQRLISGRQSDEIFDYMEGDRRERRFLYYNYLREYHLYEYVQTGKAGDEDTLKATGREYIRKESNW